MKTSTILLGAIAQLASAHYFFDTNIINGNVQPAYKYVRESSRAIKYNPIKFSSNPAEDIRDGSYADGPDIVCNQGGDKAGSTEVLTVSAGSEVRLKLGVAGTLFHPGPGLVYMSKAPGDVRAYDGSGDWFKIAEEGICNSGGDYTGDAWCTWEREWMAATIPKDTPNGEYLVRMEHVALHRSHVGQPEHYVSCAQVKVVDGGNGSPSPTVKFPGAYKDTDSYVNFSIYGGHKPVPFPGPAVWSGGGSGGNGDGGSGGGGGNCAGAYEQCGGNGWDGPTCCSSGSCKQTNEWYSQCV